MNNAFLTSTNLQNGDKIKNIEGDIWGRLGK